MPSDLQTLEQLGIDPLLPGSTVCAAMGIKARETLSRRVSRGEFPKPDKQINGKNFWFRSTVLREQGKAA
ncbi:MAG: hypothetical protein GEU87_13640 [Alphaproteobacteria bacterium]|nr:hypothetical protein [Alphaproteobacteria bacterium]